jgi:hypothetical protein
VICNAKAEVELAANVRGRAPSFDERPDDALAPLLLEFAEDHSLGLPTSRR